MIAVALSPRALRSQYHIVISFLLNGLLIGILLVRQRLQSRAQLFLLFGIETLGEHVFVVVLFFPEPW